MKCLLPYTTVLAGLAMPCPSGVLVPGTEENSLVHGTEENLPGRGGSGKRGGQGLVRGPDFAGDVE